MSLSRVYFRPVRLAALALSLIFVITAVPPAVHAASAAPRPPVPGPAAAQPLTARAAAIRQRLLAGTRRLEASKARLAAALAQLRQARAAQAAARQGIARAAAGLNNFAAAAYQDSATPQLSVLLLDEKDPQDVLTAAGYLQTAGNYQAERLADWREAQLRAGLAGVWAERAARRAAQLQRQVFTQVAALQSAAAVASAALGGAGAAPTRELRRPLPATDLASLVAAGYPNGLIPTSALCPIGITVGTAPAVLRCDAAAAFRRLASAYAPAFGHPICLTDSYRSYAQQVAVYRQRPSLAAVPGTSNHGWGLAVDLCGGLQTAGSPADRWMHANAGRFGWAHPKWAEPGGSRPEPWHWEFVGG